MPDYTQFGSEAGQYTSQSKGPKSIYYGLGDENLIGVVLPVPQTDVDDEWGRTLRIALEHMVDASSTMWNDLYTPADGGITGLKYKVDTQILGILNPTTKTLNLTGVVLDGVAGTVSTGNTVLKQGSLVNGTDFSMVTSPTQTILKHNPNIAGFSSIVLNADGVGAPVINFVLGNTGTWSLSGTALTGRAGSTVNIGSLGLSGTLNVTNVVGSGTVTVCGSLAGSLMFVDNMAGHADSVTATFKGIRTVVTAQSPNPTVTYYNAKDNTDAIVYVVRRVGGAVQVGINTDNPTASLQNNGAFVNWGQVTVCSAPIGSVLFVDNMAGHVDSVAATFKGLHTVVTAQSINPTVTYYKAKDDTNATVYVVRKVGGEVRVGINTDEPSGSLQNNGTFLNNGGATINGFLFAETFAASTSSSSPAIAAATNHPTGVSIYAYSGGPTVRGISSKVDSAAAVYYEALDYSDNRKFIVQLVGGEVRMGVGVAAPSRALEVNGSVLASSYNGSTAIITTIGASIIGVGTMTASTVSTGSLAASSVTVCGNMLLGETTTLTFPSGATIAGDMYSDNPGTQRIGNPANKWQAMYTINMFADRGQFDRVGINNAPLAAPATGSVFIFWNNTDQVLKLMNSAGQVATVTTSAFVAP